ncbi:peptide methionine sulfoxide reductase MsrA 1 isoform X2 [Poecilia formosa]|uniref:peptide methionine sulfoxide reductase MsrA 1 isoform X2 n=1 Tax=Poecilia formosa TaxID=48698 RepID=UPI0004448D76|nr:PREDICTED: peptide methionine sulfoxide reductase MsrA 1-like isoform X2 [Poecilia formosa]
MFFSRDQFIALPSWSRGLVLQGPERGLCRLQRMYMTSSLNMQRGPHQPTLLRPDKHAVNGNPTVEPFPEGMETIMFGMGCFWGAEKLFWRLPGVFSTQVGFAGGFTPNPTYNEVCTGLTAHTEVVRVVFSPQDISLEELLRQFWENHDPTQGMKQHNDSGTQYRSVIYTSSPAQQEAALKSKEAFQKELDKKGYGPITTEILEEQEFFYAEDYHQQYLKKVPKGYCGLKGTGVSCPIGGSKEEL